MEQQRKQMDKLGQELAAVRVGGPKTPSFQGLTADNIDTPTKKRKLRETEVNDQQHSYAEAIVSGVKPLSQQQQSSIRMIQNMFQQQKQQTRQKKNICVNCLI